MLLACSDDDPPVRDASLATAAESPPATGAADPAEAREPSLEIAELRRLAGGRIGLRVRHAADVELRACEWIASSSTEPARVGPAPLDEPLVIDVGPHRDGTELVYRIECLGAGERRLVSAERDITFRARPEPPSPTSLAARWLETTEKPTAIVTWSSPTSPSVRGFAIHATSFARGPTSPSVSLAAVTSESRYVLSWTAEPAADISVEVVSLDAAGTESTPATVALPSRLAALPAPANVTARREADAIVISWEYTQPGAAGFRVFDASLRIAGETTLDARARAAIDTAVAPGYPRRYAVAAVDASGRQSALGVAPALTVADGEVRARPRAPAGLTATWRVTGNAPALVLEWDPPVGAVPIDRYAVEADVAIEGELTRVSEQIPGGASEHTLRVEALRSHTVRIVAIAADDTESLPAETSVADVRSMLPPARLVRTRVLRGTDGPRIEWRWRYPDVPALRGFRIYQNDVLAADERALGPTARAWTTAPLLAADILAFRIEAILSDGSTSPAGPIAEYLDEVE
jgi:hypothetical protein